MDCRAAASFNPSITVSGGVVVVSIGKGILQPRKPGHPILYRVENHLGVLDPWQIEVLGEIIDQLFDAHMVPPPQRYLIDLEAQNRPRHASDQQPIVL